MSMPVVVIGNGGHSRVVQAVLNACQRKVIAVTGLPTQPVLASQSLVVPVMTDEQLVERFPPSEVELVMGIGSLWPCDDRSHRAWIAKRFLDQGYRFPPIVHPFSWVAPGVSIGMGSQIMAGVVVQPGSRIGDFSIINTRASVDHDCTVGNHCHLAPGVTLSGSVVIGDGTHLGTSCSVVQAVRLEKCSFIAAGATVTQSFPCGVYLRGTPARPFEPTRSRKMELPDAE